MQTTLLAQDEDYQPFQPMTRTSSSTSETVTSIQKPVTIPSAEQNNIVLEKSNQIETTPVVSTISQSVPVQTNYAPQPQQPQQNQYSQSQSVQTQQVQYAQQPQNIQNQSIITPTQAAQPQQAQQQSYSTQVARNDYVQPVQTNKPNKYCSDRFGFIPVFDQYQTILASYNVFDQARVFIADVEPNSPADRAGLKVGDEIQRIDGMRVLKFHGNLFDNGFDSDLDGRNSISLNIKSNSGGKKQVNLSRANVCTPIPISEDPMFENYWGQVSSWDVESLYLGLDKVDKISRISNKLTERARAELAMIKSEISKWISKRNQFKRIENF